jgi:hypothetical protein
VPPELERSLRRGDQLREKRPGGGSVLATVPLTRYSVTASDGMRTFPRPSPTR